MGGKKVNNKFSKKELLNMVNSKLMDLTEEEIKELINKELSKENSVVDMEYVDICFDLLESKKAMQDTPEIKEKKIGIRKPVKIILVAAVIALIMMSTLTVSAQILNFSIPQKISEFLNGNAEIDYNLKNADTTADGYALLDTNLAKALADYGISPVAFPEEMIKGNCKITNIENVSTDSFLQIVDVDFEYNGQIGNLYIRQILENVESTGVWNINNIESGKMIKANGMDILVFEKENHCSIIYKDNLTTYEINLHSDLKTAIEFAESIK